MTILRWPPLMIGGGTILGALAACSPGGFFILLSAALLSIFLWRKGGPQDRRFLATLFLSGFLLRVALSAGLDLLAWQLRGEPPFSLSPSPQGGTIAMDASRSALRMFDSDDYSERGHAMAEFARGRANPIHMAYLGNRYGWNAYLYAIGGFYYLFGFSPVSVKWINALLGALLGPAVFLLGRACFRSLGTARCAALLTAFFPSLVLWSLSNMKEPLLTLVTLLLLLLLSRLSLEKRRGRALGYGAGAVTLLLLHASLRFPVYTLALAASWGMAAWIRARQPRVQRALILLALLAGAWVARPVLHRWLVGAFLSHARFLEAQGNGYRILPDPYYTEEGRLRMSRGDMDLSPGNLLAWSGKALFHYLGEPLPRRMDNPMNLLFYPQMVVWYCMLGFALWGAFCGLLWFRERALFLILCLTAWLIIGALTNGNVGTAFRFRDMLSPLILLLGCFGAGLFLRGAEEERG